MMTWEVTTAFDGTLTETELRKRFDEEFRDVLGEESRVFFWPLVSFNASDGRKHRYLVAMADEPLENYRKKFDCCLPRQIALYAIADKILRGEWEGIAENGNMLLVALWIHRLYILVFMEGRLCHWSEELGYGESFDEACRERVAYFKDFLKVDELFANVNSAGAFGEFFVCCENFCAGENLLNMDEFFLFAAHDPYWRGKDLDKCDSMKPCERRRWMMCAVALLVLCVGIFAMCGGSLDLYAYFFDDERRNSFENVVPVELSLPATRDLEMLAWADGHRDLFPAKWNLGREGFVADVAFENRWMLRGTCDSSEFSLLGIVGGRVALVKTSAGETKTLSVGDSLSRYRVTQIGKNDVVMKCGRKEERYAVKAW
ncbi:hypothetical protein [Fibrobacter sp.]|uniref:hypothetical protein n=1 Tax=Fibrobacter sp. TaxID=35828 RepID=UPI00387039A2